MKKKDEKSINKEWYDDPPGIELPSGFLHLDVFLKELSQKVLILAARRNIEKVSRWLCSIVRWRVGIFEVAICDLNSNNKDWN